MAEITEIKKAEGESGGSSGGSSGSEATIGSTGGGAKFVSATKVQQDADKLRAKRELPKPPGNVVRFPELIDWLKLLTDEMYDRLMIYVYRHDPVINRQFVDPNADNNIDVISGQGCKNLDEDYFIDRHAGGVYGLTIKDTDVVRKGDRGYFEARLSINPTQYPPKLDYREVDWVNPKNKGYFAWARAQRIVDNNGNLMEPGKKTDTGINGGGSGSDMVGMFKAITEMVGKLNEQQQKDFKKQLGGEDAINKPMTELLIAKMKEDSPNQLMPLLTTLLPLMMKQNTPVAPQGDGGLTAIATMMTTMMTAMMKSSSDTMTMMNEANKNTMTLLTTMLANQGKGEDEGERFKQMVEIAKMIKGSPPPETSVTERLVDKGLELVLPVANIINNTLGIRAAQMGGNLHGIQQGIAQGTPPGGDNTRANLGGGVVKNAQVSQTATPTQPNSFPNSQTLPSSTINAETPPPGVSSPIEANLQGVVNTINQYGEMILQALNGGKQGWEFAESVAGVFGDIVVATVAKHGTDNLIAGMKLVPQFWGVIENSYGEAHMRKWCDEFINYKKIILEMESDGDSGEGDSGEGEEEVDTKEKV